MSLKPPAEVPLNRQVVAVITAVALAGLSVPFVMPDGTPQGPAASGQAPVTITPDVEVQDASSASDHQAADHKIACGGVSPFTHRCGRTTQLHSTAIKIGISVQPGYTGVVHYRLASPTGNVLWDCVFEDPAVPNTGLNDPDCELTSNGSFETGQSVELKGDTFVKGTGPLDDSYGQWEVSLENR